MVILWLILLLIQREFWSGHVIAFPKSAFRSWQFSFEGTLYETRRILKRLEEDKVNQSSYLRHVLALVAQRLKHLPAMQETWVQSLGREDPLEKEMETHSSILAWRIPRMEVPGWLQSKGSQRLRHDWVTSLHFTLALRTKFSMPRCSTSLII